jgi:hypothetical protein
LWDKEHEHAGDDESGDDSEEGWISGSAEDSCADFFLSFTNGCESSQGFLEKSAFFAGLNHTDIKVVEDAGFGSECCSEAGAVGDLCGNAAEDIAESGIGGLGGEYLKCAEEWYAGIELVGEE